MSDVIRGWWARAIRNSEFVCIDTYSGYHGGDRRDPKGRQIFLSPDTSDEALGLALIDVLASSRFVLPTRRTDVWQHPDVEFDLDLYDYKSNIERYSEWIKSLMERFGYKTKRALFKDMKNCSVESKNGLITISPSNHEKLELWSREDGDGIEDIVLPAASGPAELGMALRLGFDRCTG